MIFLVAMLLKLYEKIFPQKKTPIFKDFNEQRYHAGENCVFLSPTLLAKVKLREPLSELRKEFWKKDIVIPNIRIIEIETDPGFDCCIDIAGTVVFQGNIRKEHSSENPTAFVTGQIRKHFLMEEAKDKIKNHEFVMEEKR